VRKRQHVEELSDGGIRRYLLWLAVDNDFHRRAHRRRMRCLISPSPYFDDA
jgi:hypothetical protein